VKSKIELRIRENSPNIWCENPRTLSEMGNSPDSLRRWKMRCFLCFAQFLDMDRLDRYWGDPSVLHVVFWSKNVLNPSHNVVFTAGPLFAYSPSPNPLRDQSVFGFLSSPFLMGGR
jgi:hypothetical protein